ncbi:PQQ-binding-like beta-propeller repeat protein [Verrucomicrobiota bacterium]
MNSKMPDGFDEIWPKIRAEIQSADKWGKRRQKIVPLVQAAAVILLSAGIVSAIYRHIAPNSKDTCSCQPWQLSEIAHEAGMKSDYPVVRGKKVFVLRNNGTEQKIACVDKHNGEIIWESDFSVRDCRLNADDKRVYALVSRTRRDWICIALDSQSGAEVWRYQLPKTSSAPSSIVAVDKNICWNRGNKLICRDAETGRQRWSKSFDSNKILSEPVKNSGSIYIASAKVLYNVNPESGDVIWFRHYSDHSGSFIKPILKTVEERICIAQRVNPAKGVLFCMSAKDGAALWNRETSVPLNVQVAQGKICIRSNNLQTFDIKNGSLLWTAPVGGCGPVTFNDDRIYVVDKEEHAQILAFNNETGIQISRRPLAGSCAGLVVSGKMGFLSANNRTLYAIVM